MKVLSTAIRNKDFNLKVKKSRPSTLPYGRVDKRSIKKGLAFHFSLFTLLFSLYSFHLSAQDSIQIRGKLDNNTRFAKVVVQQFGLGMFDIAAVSVDKETGIFRITAPADVAPGIYRFRYSQTGYDDYVDVIINGKEKEISFRVDLFLEPDERKPIFSLSDENIAWRLFQEEQKLNLNTIRVQEDFLIRYPNKTEKSYRRINKEYEKAKMTYQQKYQAFVNKTPFYWAQAQAHFSQVYFTDISDHPRLQLFNAHEHFWATKPTTDTLLLKTPLYTDAILNYVNYYLNPAMDFSEEEQQAGYKKCVDKIIQVFGDNESTQEFAIKYLQLGFKEMGNEGILQYIDEKYAATAQCTTDDDELNERLAGYEALKLGNFAPEIFVMGVDGKEKTLFDFEQDTLILVFWASWCPHCLQEMPQVQVWANEHPEALVLAVSLDEDYNTFQNAIKDFPSMLHYCDLQKWNGEIVRDYYIRATPTFIQLDKERKVVLRAASMSKLLK